MKKIIVVLVLELFIISSLGVNAFTEFNQESLIKSTFNDEYDMVIITPSIFSSNLQPLIEHKTERNVNTILKTIEDIYHEFQGRDEIEKIKYFIKFALDNWNISYVMLVGGADLLPARYVHIYYEYDYQNEWIFLSDLYYADIYDINGDFSSWDSNENDIFGEYNWGSQHLYDDLDLYPDVYLGRLACINEDEVNICVNKIIDYETTKAFSQPWFTDLIVIGGDSLPGDEEKIDEGEYVNQGVIDNMDGFIPKKIWASNGKLYDAYNIQNAIDSGAGFVFFNGHGHLSIWATHPHESFEWIPPGSYTNLHLNTLSNGNKLPIVVSDACYHCTYDQASDCFGWTFVTNPNGGCIGFLGSTDVDVSHGGVDIVTKGIEKLCIVMSENYIQGDLTFGELWGHGLYDYLDTAEMDEMDYITVEEFQAFGDPSLAIAEESIPPEKPENLDGPTSGKTNVEYNYTASTIDPNEDKLYYLFYWGDGNFSEWIGPLNSGETVKSNHSWTNKGEYEIKVKAKDENGVQSNWSEPLIITIPRGKTYNFNLNLFILFFERFPKFFPNLKNIFKLN
jgi:hypothetical protein